MLRLELLDQDGEVTQSIFNTPALIFTEIC